MSDGPMLGPDRGRGLLSIPDAREPVGPFKAGLLGAGSTTSNALDEVKRFYYGLLSFGSPQSAEGARQSLDELERRSADDSAIYQRVKDEYPISTMIGEQVPSLAIPWGLLKRPGIGR